MGVIRPLSLWVFLFIDLCYAWDCSVYVKGQLTPNSNLSLFILLHQSIVAENGYQMLTTRSPSLAVARRNAAPRNFWSADDILCAFVVILRQTEAKLFDSLPT